MKLLAGILGRYVLVYVVNVLALMLATSILPGFRFDTTDPRWWTVLLTVPIEFAVLLILLRPLLLLLTLPLNTLTLGLPTLLFNGLILYLVADMQSAFIIDSFLDAVIALALLTFITTSAVGWLGIDEAYPFFQSVIYRIGRRFGPPRQRSVTGGVVMLQIDGLSWQSLQRAIERGRMPTISGLLARASHRLHRWHCGLPSNTPAVQAGLLYGSRADVPGYRWYDREAHRMRVASTPDDLRILENRAAEGGDPLLAGGSCINSFLSGGAAKRLVTLTAQGEPESGRRKGELADFNLFWLSPFAYTKAMLAAFWDLNTAIFWATVNRVRGKWPLLPTGLRRLAQRVVANAFLRETAVFWIKQDIVRGVPVIYSNFVGYDEVAHYSGADTYEAQVTLSAFDRKLRRLLRLMSHGAPIEYDLVLFSDHGQSASMPFRLAYGRTLKDLLAELAGGQAPIVDIPPLESIQIGALLRDLQESHVDEASWRVARGRRTLERLGEPPRRPLSREEAEDAVVVCVSGCLAHIYFEGHGRRLTLLEIRHSFPGLVEGLVSHPGIGFVVAHRQEGQPLAIGKVSVRDLTSGRVLGPRDPLAMYGDVHVWSRELRRLAEGPSSGDLIVNGSLRDGLVTVFEDQLSSHGGLGGPQTDPFLITPVSFGTEAHDLASPEMLHRHLLGRLRRKERENRVPA